MRSGNPAGSEYDLPSSRASSVGQGTALHSKKSNKGGIACTTLTAGEARAIMKIGTWYDSVEETAHHLGLPPNRGDGETGFLVRETDGKKAVAKTAGDSHPMAYCMVPPVRQTA
jgi:hypothetical protein